jgi:predicted enzyme related to lactoylglutathione lyase
MLATVLGTLCVAPVAAAPVQLPPIVQPPSQEYHVGKLIFAELVTPDLAAAEHFYSGLFGWTFRDIEGTKHAYAEAYLDGQSVAGLVERPLPPSEHRQSAWLSFFSVRDVDAAVQIAIQHGAKVLFGPRTIPDRGREAVLSDPQGAVFALLASSSGDPPDVMADPGEWTWASLHTTDPDTDAAFYQALFDYEVFDVSENPKAEHLILGSEKYARAGANPLPADRPTAHPHWLDYLRVADAGTAAAKVTALGGRVLVEPRPDSQGGRIAVVADPLGAPFGLLEMSDTESKGASQ